jgi:mevalonate kinase
MNLEPGKNRKLQKDNYYSRGKILLTGEYLVLKGAYALALPLKLGQSLFLSDGVKSGTIEWETKIREKDWFNAEFDISTLDIINTNIEASAKYISLLLKSAKTQNKNFLLGENAIHAMANLEFDINYGFGSSSTLISNIASWANIDAWELHGMVSNGSGYDIAAAQSNKPIIYKKTGIDISVNPVNFKPSFRDKIYLGYLGNKLETEPNINAFLKEKDTGKLVIKRINEITISIAGSKVIDDFIDLIAEHEYLMSELLGIKPIKELRFHDFEGQVKSLGAWGGDFALFVSEKQPEYTRRYLHEKGITPVFYYDEIIL